MYKLQKPETEDLKTILCSHKNLVFKVYLQNLPPAASSGCMATAIKHALRVLFADQRSSNAAMQACRIFLVAITKRNSTPSKVNAISLHIVHLRCQSRIFPSMEIVTTCQGIILPQSCSAFFAAISRPPQHGTSMRSTVTERISFCFRISVSFSL